MSPIRIADKRGVNLLRPFSTDTKTGGHDPDDGVRVLIDAERSPNHVGASGEALLPERITENEHMRQAGFTLLLAESPAKLRQHAKQFENSGGALNGRN